MTSHIRGSQPPRAGPRVPIIRVTSQNKQRFTIISPAVFGQDIHWYGSRSHECTKETKKCNGCERGWPAKWKGYLFCIRWLQQGEPCFLELTPRAVADLLELAEKDKPLTGLVLDLNKTPGGAKGRYQLALLERRIDSAELLPDSDPLPILRKLWLSKNQHVQD